MYKTILVVCVALTFGQMSAGLVDRIFNEDGITEVQSIERTGGSRITSGWEAYPGQFPYVASLRLFYLAGGVGNCVGSVVHHNWVLTTATCLVRPFAVVVRAGVTDLTTTPEYISETREWWIHPSFDVSIVGSLQFNNIGILKLQRTLPYSKLVQPISIQLSADAFADYAGEVVVASGWGRLWSGGTAESAWKPVINIASIENEPFLREVDTWCEDTTLFVYASDNSGDYPEVLNWVYLRAISTQECRRRYRDISETQICTTGYNDTSQSTCTDDNGGPLVHVDCNGDPVLVGLAVHLVCDSGSFAVFTRPGPFHGWLTDVTGLDFEKLNEEDTTETPEPPTTIEVTTPLTSESSEPPNSQNTTTPKLSTTEVTEPPTSEAPEPPTNEQPEPSITETPESDSEEGDDDSDGSESKEDPELSELLNKVQVKVKVKVKVNNNIKRKVKVK